MLKSAKLLPTLLIAATLVPSALSAAGPDKDKFSGYLSDYSQLQPAKDGSGQKILRWVSPAFTSATYTAVIVDPVTMYPEPKATEKVSAETLAAIADYMTKATKEQLAQQVKVVDQPGPGVARIKTAITALDAGKRGLKVYQLLPIALVGTAVKRAATGTPVDATLFVESEITDSVSGEPLLRAVREGDVKDVPKTEAGDRPVTVDAVKPLIDRWAAGAASNTPAFVGAK